MGLGAVFGSFLSRVSVLFYFDFFFTFFACEHRVYVLHFANLMQYIHLLFFPFIIVHICYINIYILFHIGHTTTFTVRHSPVSPQSSSLGLKSSI